MTMAVWAKSRGLRLRRAGAAATLLVTNRACSGSPLPTMIHNTALQTYTDPLPSFWLEVDWKRWAFPLFLSRHLSPFSSWTCRAAGRRWLIMQLRTSSSLEDAARSTSSQQCCMQHHSIPGLVPNILWGLGKWKMQKMTGSLQVGCSSMHQRSEAQNTCDGDLFLPYDTIPLVSMS